MFSYNLIRIKNKIDEKENVEQVTFPYWQHLPHLNYEESNFYFLTKDSVLNYKTTSSMSNITLDSTNTNNYLSIDDEKKLLPVPSDFEFFDNSYVENFIYLRNSSFINFFVTNMIDVPVCFKKSNSLRTKNFELPLLKFTNFLMKKGKREKINNILFSAIRVFFNKIKFENLIVLENHVNWFAFYLITTNNLWLFNNNTSKNQYFFFKEESVLSFNNPFLDNNKMINTNYFIKNYLLSLLSKVSPIFSYFIYSVDKNIRKYSRGRSGKYTFIWKYVAPYKRLNLAMRWLVKDIKFSPSKTIEDRLIKTFLNLLSSPEKSFAWKSKIFSHNYVFKNFRKSLMSSLRTTS